MPHIHIKPGQYDHTVTAYIVRTDGDDPKVLLHMHRKLGMLLPPGGHVELDETPWAAMAHELTEESGYTLDELMIMQPPIRIRELSKVVLHPYPIVLQTHDITADHFHSDSSYLLLASGEPSGIPDDSESLDLRWLSRQEVADTPGNILYDNTRQTILMIFDEFLGAWEQIPATSFSTGSPA